MAIHPLRSWLTKFGVMASHPTAFLVVTTYGLLWLYFQPHTFDWHAGAVLGWRPEVPLSEGLRLTADYFRETVSR